MELLDTLRKRRAVREFRPDRLSRAAIERLIDAAILAPSAMNRQPWAFAVLLDPERIEAYGERVKKWLLHSPEANPLGAEGNAALERPEFSVFHYAPALVMILARSGESQAAEDCCLAAENLLLAARAQDIGSCCIGLARPWLNLPATKKELSLPENYEVVITVALGHPKAWPESPGRRPAEIHWL